jgi:carbon-monoxide dehydrogenase large subunit
MATRTFGAPVQRNIDDRLLTGRGHYIDDIDLPDAAHAAFARSPFARAKIKSIDASAARAHPGVFAVYTCNDIGHIDQDLPLLIPHDSLIGARTQRPLARGDAYYVGQTVAMVVAVDRYTAEDAVRLIEIDYEPLPVTVDVDAAAGEGANLVHHDVPGNVAAHFVQNSGDAKSAFDRADHITKITVRVERSCAAPMEGRAVCARWDRITEQLTVWDGTQAPISVRGGLASLFDIDEDRVRVVAPDVGGGFGQKVLFFYPEEVLVPMASIELDRPVKWIEDRTENFVGSTQERTQIHTIELAATHDGDVIGLRDTFLHDTGAFIPYGIAIAQVASTSIAGPYRIPNIEVEFKAIYTPTVPVTPYRGCGRPQSCFAIERAMDKLAEELGLDRFEVRRRNFIQPDQFPWKREGLLFADGLAVCYDSGDYPEALKKAAEAIGLDKLDEMKAEAKSRGKHLGLGLGFYVEGTGLGPYEGGHVRIHPITGKIYVNTGLAGQGQSHETVFAQIAADQLGVDPKDVIVVEGDTSAFDWGVATFASRAAVVSGNAIHKAAAKAREMVIEAAANMLEASKDDIELEDGKARIVGSDRAVTLAEVATATNPLRYAFNKAAQSATQFAPASKHDGPPLAEGKAPGIEVTDYYSPPYSTWAYGCHAALVEVDPDLCSVAIKKYVCVHDCGNMINPTVVEGQVVGGMAQGLGGALYEKVMYDEDGNPRNAGFMDFLMPYATEMPKIDIVHMETPSPLNPLGIKGVGEAGTIAVPATVISGIEDALKPLGAGHFHEAPVFPHMIFEKLETAEKAA